MKGFSKQNALLVILIGTLLIGLSVSVSAPVAISKVDGYDPRLSMPSFSYDADGNLTIDFNLSTDVNYGGYKADLNYSLTNTQGSGTPIVKGLVIDGNYCQTNFIGDWNNTPNSDVNLVGYWKFDAQEDDYNAERAFDYSGQGHHGTYIEGADNNASGKWDTNAGYFDGVDDYVEISAAEEFYDLNESFSLSTWFYADGSQNKRATILEKTGFFWIGYDYDGELEFALRDQNSDQNYNTLDNTYLIKRITTTAETNKWQQATATFDGTSIKLYLNGTMQANGTVMQALKPYCIDQYEASHSDATFCDNSSVWTGTCDATYGSSPIPASQPDRIPWVNISQTSAATACTAAGKHLCSSAEWMAAANLNGQIYDLSDATTDAACVVDSTNYCSDHSASSGEACNTGSNNTISPSNCKSTEGVYDLIGNVYDRTSDVVDVNTDSPTGWNYPNDDIGYLWGNTIKSKHYGNDGVYTSADKAGRAVLRGGTWYHGSNAGLFFVLLAFVPGSANSYIGFRCCDEPTVYNACDQNMAFINPSIKLGNDTNAFKGQIDEVKIYNRALTPAEISMDYNLGVVNHRSCSYDWNISGIADANYYASVLAYDDAGHSDFNASANSFHVNPSGEPPEDSCSCPASGNWEIINSDNCKLTTPCRVTGNVNVINGSLEVDTGAGGRLFVPKEYKIHGSKANGKLTWGK